MSKNILIVGAAAGMGKEVSLEFARKGYNLGLIDMNQQALNDFENQLAKEFPSIKVATKQLDISDYDAVAPAFDALQQALGKLDIIFSNAGIGLGGDVGDVGNFSAARKTIEVNLLGTIACIEKAASIFRTQGFGHIAVTSSLSAIRGTAGDGYAAYSASKSGVNRYMESLYAELLRDGLHKKITTGVLMPGHVATGMAKDTDSMVIPLHKATQAMVKAIEQRKRSVVICGFTWKFIKLLMQILPTRALNAMA